MSLIHAVRQRRRSGLVNNALDIEARDSASIFCGLTLRVVEICRDGNHRFFNFFAQKVFCRLFHFTQDLSRDLGRGKTIVFNLDPSIAIICLDDLVGHHLDVSLDYIVFKLPTYQSLNREQSIVRIRHRLALGGLSH